MQKKNKHGLIVVLVVAALGAGAYFIIKSRKSSGAAKTKVEKVNAIIADPKSGTQGSDYFNMIGFGDDYITAWYTALQAVQPYFMLGGHKYNTVGGKSVA